MQIFFEANTADFAKRKRVARACATCQKRKKRCQHVFKDQEAADDDPTVPVLAHKEPVRFVGDLNPESVLRDLSSRSKGVPRECPVGVFVDPALQAETNGVQQAISPNELSGFKSAVVVDRHGKIDRGFRTLTVPEKTYLQSVGAFRKLPKTTEEVLITTWFSCIDGIMPLLDSPKFLHDYAAKPKSTVSPFLILAMCLITCKTEEALGYLRLTDGGPLLDPISFARNLYIGLDAAMKLDLEADRLTKIQILALMSLHNDSPSGLEDASYHLSHAIHDANTSALHINTPGRTPTDQPTYVYWCLWVLDKINACIAGRSMMIHDRDISIPRPSIDDSGKSHSLAIWLALADVLVDVIDLYRPTADHTCTGWEENFPSFSYIVKPYKFHKLDPSEQKILELFYNIIAILSCRTASPNHASYARRLQAGNEIQRLMSAGFHEHIPPFPLVPYAVSLSLTVAYRVIRDRNFSYRDPAAQRARENLATRCDILESLAPRYWPADAMAKLGRKALSSLTKPGVDTKNTLVLARQMDHEVTPCRDQNVGPGGTQPSDVPGSNALHVLSSAAAQYGNGANGGPTRERASALAAVNNIGGTTITTAAGVAPAPTPMGLGGIPATFNSDIATTMPATPAGMTSTSSTNDSSTNTNQYTPETFQNLDALFDDFFDLSMPTFFQDPLFDGAQFGLDFEGLFGSMDGNAATTSPAAAITNGTIMNGGNTVV